MISSPPPSRPPLPPLHSPPILPSASPLCSLKTFSSTCWFIDHDALRARGEVCEDYKMPVAFWETSIPTAWWDTAHNYSYWRACSAHPQRRDKCSNGMEMPVFSCPSAGPIIPTRGTVNGAIVAGAGQEMPLDLSGSNSDLRYFSVVRTAASANSEQPFSGMSVQGRTIHQAREHTGLQTRTVQIGLDLEDASLIIKDPSVAHNFVVRRVGTRFFGMGGTGLLSNGAEYAGAGIRLFMADSAAEVHSGRWLSSAGSVIIRNDHPGCIEARPQFNGKCEYDGKLSFVRMASAGSVVWHVFARANLKPLGGGRFVHVANASSAQGPYGAFQRIQIDGYDEGGPGNVYFAAVDNNPLDTETMLGLFPVNLGNEEEGGNGNGESFIALGLSCDGVHWGNLTRLVWTNGQMGRTWDHPVDGVVLHGDKVYFMVTRHSNPRHARACRTADCVARPPATLLTLLNLLVAGA